MFKILRKPFVFFKRPVRHHFKSVWSLHFWSHILSCILRPCFPDVYFFPWGCFLLWKSFAIWRGGVEDRVKISNSASPNFFSKFCLETGQLILKLFSPFLQFLWSMRRSQAVLSVLCLEISLFRKYSLVVISSHFPWYHREHCCQTFFQYVTKFPFHLASSHFSIL